MNKFVIYFAGGTMRGVFGAGVATAFERAKIYSRLKAVYCASAGVMTGAYFLARQTELGSSIYWEDLQSNFISRKDFFIGVWQRFQSEFFWKVPDKKLHDAFDVDFLINTMRKKKKLNTKKIISQDIPLRVKLFNLDSYEIEYFDACCPEIFKVLKAGISAFPYVHKVVALGDKKYIDAAIMEIVGTDYLARKHPNEKIIIVMNGQTDRKLRYRIKNIIEGKFVKWMLGDPGFYELHAAAEDKLKKDIEIIKANPRFLLVSPKNDFSVRSRTTDRESLLRMYHAGIEAGERALKSKFMGMA